MPVWAATTDARHGAQEVLSSSRQRQWKQSIPAKLDSETSRVVLSFPTLLVLKALQCERRMARTQVLKAADAELAAEFLKPHNAARRRRWRLFVK